MSAEEPKVKRVKGDDEESKPERSGRIDSTDSYHSLTGETRERNKVGELAILQPGLVVLFFFPPFVS
jgi:hypothetical protein